MNIYNDDVKKILKESKNYAYKNHNDYISLFHIINASIKLNINVSKILKKHDIKEINIPKTSNIKNIIPMFSNDVKKNIEKALFYNKENNINTLNAETLILTIFKDKTNPVYKKYYNNTNYLSLINELENKKPLCIINKLGTDFTDKNVNSYFDKVIGRDEEISRIINILKRKNKNNPVLVGDAGVGKTAIIEELGRRIQKKEVPNFLWNKSLISINISNVIAGTKYRGEFEEKLTSIINETINNKNIILFIDELHTVVGAGGAEGAIDASNILKPYLSRGELKLIGATTINEYNKIIKKDEALDRRFQKVYINEPSVEKTIYILKKIKKDYELFHNVKISNNLIYQIAFLSDKYIPNKKNPDKSIDLLDEICAKESIVLLEDKKIEISKKITYYNNKRKQYIKNKDYNKATLYKQKALDQTNKLERLNNKNITCNVRLSTLKNVLEEKTNQTIIELDSDNKYYLNIKNTIKDNILGQNKAINDFIKILKIQKYKTSNLPTIIHLIGEKNTGKHLFINTYAKINNTNIITINANNFNKETTNNMLLGSPQGYVGYDDDNVLSKLLDYPDSIILVENYDNFNSSLNNIFNQITKNGYIINNKSERINFNNNLIFYISNNTTKNNLGYITNNNIIKENNNFNTIKFNSLKDYQIKNIIKKEILKIINNLNKEINLNKIDYNKILLNYKKYNDYQMAIEKYLEDLLLTI